MTPMPPACAMAMASRDSVTVSIADETIGMLSVICDVSFERRSTMCGMTSEWAGFRSTSSKVSASSMGGRGGFGHCGCQLFRFEARPERIARRPKLAVADIMRTTEVKWLDDRVQQRRVRPQGGLDGMV